MICFYILCEKSRSFEQTPVKLLNYEKISIFLKHLYISNDTKYLKKHSLYI